MSEVLEFHHQSVMSSITGESIVVAVPSALPESPDTSPEVLTIEGNEIELATAIVQQLARTLYTVRRMIEARDYIRIDCMVFGTIFAGGSVNPHVYAEEAFPYRQTNLYRKVDTIDKASDVAQVLQPSILGSVVRVDDEHMLGPEHMVVALDPNADLYVQKFGNSYIGISGLAEAAKLYEADSIGSLLASRTRNAQHSTLMSYKAPDARTVRPDPVKTLVNIPGR